MTLSASDKLNKFRVDLVCATVGIPGDRNVFPVNPIAEFAQSRPVDHEEVVVKTHAVNPIVLSQERDLLQDAARGLSPILALMEIHHIAKGTTEEAAARGDHDQLAPRCG